MDRIAAWLSQADNDEFDPGANAFPEDQPTLSNLARTFSISSTSAATVVASSKQKRILLAKSIPNFRFLGASGRGGLHIKDSFDKWVPQSIRQLISSFRRSSSDRWVLCNCLRNLLSEEDSLDALEGDQFQTCSCNDNVKTSRQLEARSVLKLVRRANDIQAGAAEGNNWVAHSISLLQLAIGESGETYPLQVDSVTATDLHREFCPRVRWRPSRSRSSSPKKRKRRASGIATPSQTPLVDEILMARADIAITLLNCDETESFRNNINTKFGRFELPLPLKNMDQLPILTLGVKSLDGSSLEVENQATICANSILQSWRCLGMPSIYSKTGQACDVVYPTRIRSQETDRRVNAQATTDAEMTAENATGSISLHATEEIKEVGIDHVFGMHVNAYIWSYIVVYTDSSGESDEEVAARGGYSRRVLGPYIVGDTRTIEGVYKILRFLDRLFNYKANVWLPGIAQRDPIPFATNR
ncbi:hypothetical protein TWF730_011290 [Orbilia blumenaviensis]|uniref:Uncharacterized protein n=1 Tax=Orbilia blumenaviensis TaxID=1796055 RepID=A0AAV9UKV1_9PEZI